MFTPPNFFSGLMRVVAWVFWRDPVAKSEPPQPKRPRKPTLGYTVGDIPYELLAVVRVSWYRKGMTYEVEEYQIEESDDALPQFHYIVVQALQARRGRVRTDPVRAGRTWCARIRRYPLCVATKCSIGHWYALGR
jgi:hypothetical protein